MDTMFGILQKTSKGLDLPPEHSPRTVGFIDRTVDGCF